MANSELELLKQEIDLLREQMYAYMEYPEIFKDELLETSNKIDILINKYITLSNK
ncbi:MAG TPA: aspartyl-phosphate phosphatase Spo0E family protein [Romboutsia timonensis]|uniref:Aspartyl-phosphate phosphatase Spo0E family protein n=1 Tax=Romboutsia timonensis TaxID=1776391 RepID=A0A921N1B6_9FIRM|nr:aspartyl-phosphate phosphatase Spo0E family protein [uncultured Romboutsia sp.]HJG96545.1 aspartyl-phosphate phosphatase Spo0E family protein [Romboutsia timonensis]